MHLSIDAIDYEAGKLSAAHDYACMALDRAPYMPAADAMEAAGRHAYAVGVLLLRDGRMDTSGSIGRQAHYARVDRDSDAREAERLRHVDAAYE